MVIAEATFEVSLETASVDSGAGDSEFGRDLFDSQPSLVDQAFLEALDPGRIPEPLDADGVEGIAGAGPHSAFVEDPGRLGIGIFIQQAIDLMDHVRVSGSHL